MSLKLGVVPYLNPLPLYFSLRNRSDIEIVADFPSRLGARLDAGEFDAALLPVADHIRGLGDGILGDAIVGATGQVRSVLLFSRVEIDKIRRVALDTSSHTSVALIRVILHDFYGLKPRFFDHPPDLEAMLQRADAAVLIGDPALVAAQNSGDWRVYDMAELWHRSTGKSFVFAAWIARHGLENRAELENLLNSARDEGETQIAAIVAANPLGTSLPDAVVQSYLTKAIQYHLTPSHRAGLEEFGRRLGAHQ
ncbi:MAG TPA: menaquinone biosynthesis protein [Abditibacterium sp.]